ncbi:hypothetical protein FGM00_04685 [Aggregatimonas sangjinii]|uniref:DUF6268 domain-containing protein n=1 Tax=Aggregatimonas sangjinii TaxID=2583587 RepID=A0A5B7SPW5_9FLAO|nr:DUF6268 family outer membrane beta-barrel protein [Aggregatimonas sangjinii]QCW99438.1 hypothetical protein FGM00_04685 [Aggregatimonas sangjinii]
MPKNKFDNLFFALIVGILIFHTSASHSQLSDLARVDYTLLPATDDGFEYEAARVTLNYPIKIKSGTYLFVGAGYANIDLNFGKEPQPFNTNAIDGLQVFELNIGYTFPLKKDWRFAARFAPGMSSNLAADKLKADDLVLSGELVFLRDRTKSQDGSKPSRLIFGISYSGNRGFPYPLPFLSYYRKFHPKWSYNLGVPKTNLQYHISEKHRLKLYAELDGFTSNIQNGIPLLNGDSAESINMSLILMSLQYEFHFLDHFEFFCRASYILDKRVQLRDSEKDNILLLDDTRGTYFRTGLRFKI